MPSTSRGYPYPSGSDDVDIPGDIQALADAVNTDVGTIATTTPSAPVLQTLADAAGDLAVGSAADTFGRLALGTDNYALTVNTGGAGVAKVGWEDPTANPLTAAALALKLDLSAVGNLYSTNVSTFEDGTTVWINAGGSPTLSNDATYARLGTRSLKLVTNGTGSNLTWPATAPHTTPVSPLTPFTASLYARTDTAGELVSIAICLYQSDGTTATTTKAITYSPIAYGSTTDWQRFLATVTTPADAAFAEVLFQRVSGGATVSHWIDSAGLWKGTEGDWAAPGSAITGTKSELTSAQSSAVNMLSNTHTNTTSGWSGTNATITATTADKYGASTGSIVLTATSATAAQASSAAPTATSIAHPAVVGETYTLSGFAKLSSGVRYAYAQIQWYADAVYISSTAQQYVHLTTAGWTRVTTTGVAPATATAMRLIIFAPGLTAAGSAIGDVIYYSGLTLNRGIGGDSASPGAPVLGTMPVEAAYKVQVGNMLAPQIATGTEANADASGFVPGNGTLTSSTAEYDRGTRSLCATSTGVSVVSLYPNVTGYTGAPATPGVPYTSHVRMKNGTSTATYVNVLLYFYKADGTAATGSPFTGSTVNVSASGWTTVRYTKVAPADAAYVMPYWSWASGGAGETMYLDSFGVWQGPGGEWAYPGTPVPGLGQYTDESVGRRTFVWDQVNQRFQMVYGDTGSRDMQTVFGTLPASLDWASTDITTVLLRRVGNVCTLTFGYRFLKVLAASGTSVSWGSAVLPSGFRNNGHVTAGFRDSTGDGFAELALNGYHGAVAMLFNWSGMTIGSQIPVSFTWTTADSWPTTLPGTASGSIPA